MYHEVFWNQILNKEDEVILTLHFTSSDIYYMSNLLKKTIFYIAKFKFPFGI